MANIIQFPKQKAKNFNVISELLDEVDTVQAVNELTCELLAEVIPVYVERRWSLAELDPVIHDFTRLMIANAPERIVRADLNELKSRLRPIWKDLLSSVHHLED
jgi:hypothetical protein